MSPTSLYQKIEQTRVSQFRDLTRMIEQNWVGASSYWLSNFVYKGCVIQIWILTSTKRKASKRTLFWSYVKKSFLWIFLRKQLIFENFLIDVLISCPTWMVALNNESPLPSLIRFLRINTGLKNIGTAVANMFNFNKYTNMQIYRPGEYWHNYKYFQFQFKPGFFDCPKEPKK